MTRQVFDKLAQAPKLHPIPDGCADIARHLGLAPKDTFWDYNATFSVESGQKFTDRTLGVVQEGVTSLIRDGSNGLALKLYPGFLEYQQRHVGVGNVIELTDRRIDGNVFLYPEHAIGPALAHRAQRDARLAEAVSGKVLCPLICVPEMETAAQTVGATTLLTAEQAARFNSKVRVVTQAAGEQYNVAPHVVANSWAELEPKMKDLGDKAEAMGLDPQQTKYWVKFDNLAGGQGVMPYNPQETRFDKVKDWIRQGLQESGRKPDDFVPVIMDIDIGHLPDVKRVLTNMNVQAIVGPGGVGVTGTTFQKTENGHYIGGLLPLTEQEKAYAKEGPQWALPVLDAARRQGYRGYAGIDVILCEGHNGQTVGYILEMNGRLNSSTSLLSMSHHVARESGLPQVEACNLSSEFAPQRDFNEFARRFAPVLYKGASSGYEGIVPIIMKPDEQGRIKGVKTIAVAPDARRLAEVERRYGQIVSRLG